MHDTLLVMLDPLLRQTVTLLNKQARIPHPRDRSEQACERLQRTLCAKTLEV